MALLALSPAQRASQLCCVEGRVANVLVMVVHHAAGIEGNQDAARALDGLERPVEDTLSLQSAIYDIQKAWNISFLILEHDSPHHVARTQGEYKAIGAPCNDKIFSAEGSFRIARIASLP